MCPSSSLSSALHKISTCKITNSHTQGPPEWCKSNLEISELIGKLWVGGWAWAHHILAAQPPFSLPPSQSPCQNCWPCRRAKISFLRVWNSQGLWIWQCNILQFGLRPIVLLSHTSDTARKGPKPVQTVFLRWKWRNWLWGVQSHDEQHSRQLQKKLNYFSARLVNPKTR